MIDKLEKKCMGCGACKNICPKDAIRLTYEKSLFYEPSVDYDLCIKCGKCTSICPAVSFLSKNNNNPTAFAIASNDEERLKSSSGAFFPILAKHILNQNGFVCGAAWTEDWNVQHIIVSNSKDVGKLRLSKYVQSNTGNCFREIKNKLLNNELVLFSGTPCQNAGLKNYLGKEYDNLITMDLLCHGSPSPKIWDEYLRSNFNIENIKEIRFRTKDNGWVSNYKCPFDEKYSYIDDGQKKPIGLYYVSFLRHIISTDACIDCKYKGLPRVADFTCGDFWAYKKYNENLNDNKGLSVVLINNRKAESIFENIKNQFIVCEQIDMTGKWEDIEISNKSRFRNERYMFYKNFDKFSLNKSLELASRTHFDIGLVSFFNGMNYGSSLVAFATNKILENLGYSVLMINKPYNAIYPYDETNKSYEFAKTHFYLSNFYERNESCDYINNLVDTFIVGSDTQWWWNDVSSIKYHPWLDFVQADKRKISLSTSFANDFTDIPKEEIPKIKKLYERFDSLSVREKSGVTILSEVFGIEKSEALIDPTLVLDSNYYDEIIEESELQVKNYVFAYILDLTEDKENALIDFSKKINKPLRVVPRQYHKGSMKIVTDNNCSIPDFLYLIKNADLVITDSFHGACFSVIFEKNFATMINNKRENTRFEIFKQMGLSKCLLDSPEELQRFNFDEQVDFSETRIFIEKERCKFYDYLKKSLHS